MQSTQSEDRFQQHQFTLLSFNVGCAILDNDCKYEGLFNNGLMHGNGKFMWANGVEYEGNFFYGKVKSCALFIEIVTQGTIKLPFSKA